MVGLEKNHPQKWPNLGATIGLPFCEGVGWVPGGPDDYCATAFPKEIAHAAVADLATDCSDRGIPAGVIDRKWRATSNLLGSDRSGLAVSSPKKVNGMNFMTTPMDDLDQATRALAGTSMRDPSVPQASDPRSTSELVALYLRDPQTHESGQALAVVQYRGGKEEFEIAARLAGSSLAHERRVAADILAQLGWQGRTYLPESIEILLRLLNDPEPAVLQAAAIACGHRKSPATADRLVKLAGHPIVEVRYGVSYGLAGQDAPAAVAALVLLSNDEDRDVRDWATFALGSQTDLDTFELREALRARLTDDDLEIRGEALVGLGRRRR